MSLKIVGDVQVGFPALRTGYGQRTYGNTQPQTERATWIALDADGGITAYAGKVEYGQNIRTGLAIEVADELRVPLEAVQIVLGDTDRVPWDMGTFGSQSTARVGWQLRKAAATARETLLTLAADRLDLPVDALEASDGRVASKADGSRGVTYADLLRGQEIEREIAANPLVTPASEFTVMGRKHAQRIDGIDRVTGRSKYSQDVLPEGVLFAAIVRPPAYGGRAKHVDLSAAERLPGVARVVHEGELIAVLGEDDDAAALGARVAQVEWEIPTGQPSRFDLPSVLVQSGT